MFDRRIGPDAGTNADPVSRPETVDVRKKFLHLRRAQNRVETLGDEARIMRR